MKSIAVLAVLLASAPALAAPPAPVPTPTPTPPPVAAQRLSIETPIETIAADPAGKAFLDANMPGLTTHPMYDSFKGMSLKQLAPMSGGRITDEALAKANAGLAAIK